MSELLSNIYNNFIYYGQKFGINSERYLRYSVIYFNQFFSKLNNDNIYLYLIIFITYISYILHSVSSISNDEKSIKTYVSMTNLDIENIISYYSNITLFTKILLYSYIFIFFKRILYSNFYSIGISISILLFLFLVFYSTNINSEIYTYEEQLKMKIATYICMGVYALMFIPMLISYGDIPDTFFLSYIIFSIIVYSIFSPGSRSNMIYILKRHLSLIIIIGINYNLISNINFTNTRTINIMNIILSISIILIYLFSNNFINKLPDILQDYIGTNQESISYFYNKGSIIDNKSDCKNFNSDEQPCQ